MAGRTVGLRQEIGASLYLCMRMFVPFASAITDAMSSSGFSIETQSIPFYQCVRVLSFSNNADKLAGNSVKALLFLPKAVFHRPLAC